MKKGVLASALAIALCVAVPTQSFAIMSCGNSWLPVANGTGISSGLTTFSLPAGGDILPIEMTTPAYFASTIEGAPAFTPADYSLDCSVPLFPVGSPYGATFTPGVYVTAEVAVNACRINKAPTVDMAFVASLQAQGYMVAISYPVTDPGTGIALVTWAKLSNGFNVACPAGQGGYDADGQVQADGCAVSNIGLAYVSGAGWQNQFAAVSGSTDKCNYDLMTRSCSYQTVSWSYPYGSIYGDQMASSLGGSDFGSSVIAGIWGPHPSAGPGTCPEQLSAAAPIAMIGNFATPPAPPPIPLSPPSAPPGNNPAASTNVNASSDPAGSGTPSGGSDPSNPGSQYSWVAYCNSPNRDGTPRSADFVQSCLATHQPL